VSVEIRQTTVTPDAGGCAVQLHISDATLGAEAAETVIQLHIRLPRYEQPVAIEQYQRQAIVAAIEIFRSFDDSLAREIRRNIHLSLTPKPAP
jgi:hypothetical protein